MPTASQQPGGKTHDGPGLPRDPDTGKGPPVADSGIWLDGGVLACACPECGGPMSIRLWLMVADCFRCGTSIELTEQQEQEVLRLLGQQGKPQRVDSQRAAATLPGVARKPPSRVAAAVPAAPAAAPGRVPASRVLRRGLDRHPSPSAKGRLAAMLNALLKNLPAWLVSLVVHLMALLLLSLWYPAVRDDQPAITLSTSISPDDIEGQQGRQDDLLVEAFEFEDPGAERLEGTTPQAGAPGEEPPARLGRMFEGRDPEVRGHLVERSGGTLQTEAAVARGLVFLARHQNRDGSWSLHDFARTPDCDATCTGAGYVRSDVAATALALLPFLGAGQTHREGPYREEVRRGLDWLVRRQQSDGRLWDDGRMYAHGQAAIALSEAYAMTRDPRLQGPAQQALDFIVRAQHSAGGWRYEPGQAGDTSVVGWELMALRSGQMAYLRVPRETFDLADGFLNSAQRDAYGGRYAYQPRGLATPAMTAEALLCRQYLGWPREHVGLRAGVAYLLEHLPEADNPNIYYWYYATQVMHHFGGRPWETWNTRMSHTLVSTQETAGHAAGSWAPRGRATEGGYAEHAGRIYMTSLAICILEVYYRHMPIYGEEVLAGFEQG